MKKYIFLLLFWCSITNSAFPIKVLLSDNYIPFSHRENNKAVGIIPDLLNAVFKNSNDYQLTIEALPWTRVQVIAENCSNCAIVTIPTNNRLKIYNRGKENFLMTQMKVFTSINNKNISTIAKLNKISDFKQFQICEYNSSGWAKSNFLNVLPKIALSASLQTKIKMVAYNRCDLGFENEIILKNYAKNLGVSDKIQIINKANWPVEYTFLINKNFTNQKILNFVDQRIIELERSGEIKNIVSKWTE